MTQNLRSMALFHGNTQMPYPMKKVSSMVLVGVQSQLLGGKNNDVIVPSSLAFAILVAQLMPATTVLHVSQADIDYTILRSVEPWDDVQAIAKFVGIYQADACIRD